MHPVLLILAFLAGLYLLLGIAVVAWAKTKYGLSSDGSLILSLIAWPVILLGITISESKSETPEYTDPEYNTDIE